MCLDVSREFRGVRLGDWRRENRLRQIVRAIQKRPADSFPRAMADRAECEGFYRLMENKAVSFAALFAPHSRETAERCVRQKTVLVVHDSSSFSFAGDGRSGLGKINSGVSIGTPALRAT